MITESMLGLSLSTPAAPSLECPRTHQVPGYPEDSAVVILDAEILGSTADFSEETIGSDNTATT